MLRSRLGKRKPPSEWTDPVDHPTGSLDQAKEIAQEETQKGGKEMAIKRIGRKILTNVAGLIGAGSIGSLSTGSVITGDVLVEIALLLVCLVLILVNGKDGVPDWLVQMVKGSPKGEKGKKKKK